MIESRSWFFPSNPISIGASLVHGELQYHRIFGYSWARPGPAQSQLELDQGFNLLQKQLLNGSRRLTKTLLRFGELFFELLNPVLSIISSLFLIQSLPKDQRLFLKPQNIRLYFLCFIMFFCLLLSFLSSSVRTLSPSPTVSSPPPVSSVSSIDSSTTKSMRHKRELFYCSHQVLHHSLNHSLLDSCFLKVKRLFLEKCVFMCLSKQNKLAEDMFKLRQFFQLICSHRLTIFILGFLLYSVYL